MLISLLTITKILNNNGISFATNSFPQHNNIVRLTDGGPNRFYYDLESQRILSLENCKTWGKLFIKEFKNANRH